VCARARKCGCVFECVFVRDGVKMTMCCVNVLLYMYEALGVCVCARAQVCVCVEVCVCKG